VRIIEDREKAETCNGGDYITGGPLDNW